MACVFHTPQLEDALSLFLPGHGDGVFGRPPLSGSPSHRPEARVAGVSLPVRRATPTVERAAFYAVCENLRLRVDYGSLSGRREPGWRQLVPRAFAHDGYRWHLRAWCEENGEFRDFVLSRVREATWPNESAPPDLPDDVEWESFDELVLAPSPDLPESTRASIAWDFGMNNGVLRLKVRRAMRNYTLMHLRLPTDSMKPLPPLLVLVPEG